MIIKEKCWNLDVNGTQKTLYHYFDINIDETDIITVKVDRGSLEYFEKYLSYKATWHIPVQKVPELLSNIIFNFFCFNPYKNNCKSTNLGDSKFVFGPGLNERSERFDDIFVYQTNDSEEFRNTRTEIFDEQFTFEWNDKYATPMELNGRRIMPKSLVAFLDGLKKTYNTWQKNHPECEKIK